VDSQATVEIPNELESVETFQFLEFRPEAAKLAFDGFLQRRSQFPDRADVLSSARDHIMSIKGDAFSQTDDWIGVMDRIGLTTGYQSRVMDPDYSHMRLTGSAKHWAIEMVTMRFEFLSSLDTFIKNHAQRPNRKVSHVDFVSKLKPGPSYPIPKRDSSIGLPAGIFPASGPSTTTASDTPPAEMDGHHIFYKGGSLARLNKIHFGNNRLNIRQIRSRAPGDFDGDSGALYLTKQAPVAWEYAAFWRSQSLTISSFRSHRLPATNGDSWCGPLVD
jgi:hypothetical protein